MVDKPSRTSSGNYPPGSNSNLQRSSLSISDTVGNQQRTRTSTEYSDIIDLEEECKAFLVDKWLLHHQRTTEANLLCLGCRHLPVLGSAAEREHRL